MIIWIYKIVILLVFNLIIFMLVTYQSEKYQKVLFTLFFLNFFLGVFPFLKSEEINYFAYYSIIVAVSAITYLFKDFKLKLNSAIIYLSYFMLNLFIMWPSGYLLENYMLLVMPSLSLSMYILFRYYVTYVNIRFFLIFLLLIAIIQSILGLSQSFWGYPNLGLSENIFQSDRNYFSILFPWVSPLVRHGTGTFLHFNGLGSFLTISIPFLFANWLTNKKNILNIIIFLIVFAGVMTTYSRGAFLGSFFGCAVYYFMFRKSNIKILILNGLLFLAIAIYFSDSFQFYFQQTENLSFRLMMWDWSVSYIVNNPLKMVFGYGVTFFRNEFYLQYGTVTDLHSGIIQITLELGMVGILLFLWILKSIMNFRINNKNNQLYLACFASIFGFLAHQIFDNALLGQLSVIFFIIIGILHRLQALD